MINNVSFGTTARPNNMSFKARTEEITQKVDAAISNKELCSGQASPLNMINDFFKGLQVQMKNKPGTPDEFHYILGVKGQKIDESLKDIKVTYKEFAADNKKRTETLEEFDKRINTMQFKCKPLLPLADQTCDCHAGLTQSEASIAIMRDLDIDIPFTIEISK